MEKYNKEQLITTKLPGASEHVIISEYNCLPDGRFFDVGCQSSFEFDHAKQVCFYLGHMGEWVGEGGKLMKGVGWVESFESAELGLGEWECGVDVSFPFLLFYVLEGRGD